MVPLIPFLYEKVKRNKFKEQQLPLYIEDDTYFESPQYEEQEDTPHVIIMDIM